jgi:DNA invertase Pin-like site-specific DNA recombinase
MPHVAADSPAAQSAPLIRAAAYARMSTDHQIYSIDNQLAAIREYAERNQLTVVREYLDPGRSGLDLKGRPGLVRLLTDVQEGRADYEVILIYDVSRWGRFQDIDESAYYEYACRKANIGVVYCAEPFKNETGDALAAIIKNIKRVMAA